MDQRIRRLRDGTPEECYVALMRAGYHEDDIRGTLLDSGKIPSNKPGMFEQIQVNLGIKDLHDARLEIANRLFEAEEEEIEEDGGEFAYIQVDWDVRGNMMDSNRRTLDLDGYERTYVARLGDEMLDEGEEERVYHVDFFINSTLIYDFGTISEDSERWRYK